jgi:putative membrane protein
MRFWLRWTANAVAFFLALYLVDSLAAARFRMQAVWVAVVLALLLGLMNSFVRPLRGLKRKPLGALLVAMLTVLMNALILQLFVWSGASLSSTSFVWVLAAGAFLSLLAGVINWLIGFNSKEKGREAARKRTGPGLSRTRGQQTPRT